METTDLKQEFFSFLSFIKKGAKYMNTKENLLSAFAGESQANRKYLAFAKKAGKEGFKNISRIFQAIAEAETIHALKHFEIAGQVGKTLENLTESERDENYEYTRMYPLLIETARQEKQQQARKSFEYANRAEKVHGAIFQGLKETVAKGSDASANEILLCPICGWVGLDEVLDHCPICHTPSKSFQQY